MVIFVQTDHISFKNRDVTPNDMNCVVGNNQLSTIRAILKSEKSLLLYGLMQELICKYIYLKNQLLQHPLQLFTTFSFFE
jgi:hypothetical protein